MSAPAPQTQRRERSLFDQITNSSVTITVLAIIAGLVGGGILIAITNDAVRETSGYFFSQPGDMIAAIGAAIGGAYSSLFQGSIFNFGRPDFAGAIKPLLDTLSFATPLIAAGLGVGLTFRVGMFNIGGRGQMLIAAAAAGWVGFAVPLPGGLHLVAAVLAGIAGGALWGGIVGLIKARTGAHEVILTIMLNFVAFNLIQFMLRTPGLLQAPGSVNPVTPPVEQTAALPKLFGDRYGVDLGFILALVATGFVWWLFNRSALGVQFRAVGENPHAAKVAGIHVPRMYVYAMLLSGALVGLAGTTQALGPGQRGFSDGIDAGIGFEAITVALLGRSRPLGILGAGLLFGALKAGSFSMQAANDVPIDIVLVVQSIIVLLIAAPPLVKGLFFLNRKNKSAVLETALAQEVTAK